MRTERRGSSPPKSNIAKPNPRREFIRMLNEVFSKSTRAKLIFLIIGTSIVSLLDVVGVLAMVPLMSALTGDAAAAAAGASFLSAVLPPVGSDQYVLAAAVLLAGAFVLKAVFGIAFRWWALGVLTHEQVRVASEVMRRHLLAPYAMHRRRGYAELTNVLGGVIPMSFRAMATVLVVLSEALTIFMVALAVLAIQPVLATVAFVLLGGLGAIFQRIVRARQQRLGRQTILLGQVASAAQLQAYGGAQEVKLRGNAEPFVDTYEDANLSAVETQRQLTFIGELPKYLFEVMFVVVLAVAAVVLFVVSGADGAALVALATFGVAGVRMLPSAVRLLASVGLLRTSWPGVTALLWEIDSLNGIDESVPPRGEVDYPGDIEIQNLSFAYADAPEANVLNRVSVTVPRGTSIALVGPSGSGKSTLVDLILGLQRPTSGVLRSGGKDIWKSIGDWRSSVAVVPQDVFLLNDSLRRNIVFDVPDDAINENLLTDVIRRAQLEDLIADTPEGMELVVGDRGARLSGGQRQRVGIARALYRRPDVLVLDEATSALDNITEQRITETIEALRGDITVVMVAHRLSTVRDADQFIVLEGGVVAALGTFEQVRDKSPMFAELVRLASLRRDDPA